MKSIQSLHPMIFCCKFCPDGTRNLSPPWLWKFESRIASSNTCCHSKHNLCSLTWSVILYHAFGQQRPSSLLYALPKLDHYRQWCDLPWCVLLECLAICGKITATILPSRSRWQCYSPLWTNQLCQSACIVVSKSHHGIVITQQPWLQVCSELL